VREFVGILISLASALGLGVLLLTWFILTHYLIYNTFLFRNGGSFNFAREFSRKQ
jgi:hypothetical protein